MKRYLSVRLLILAFGLSLGTPAIAAEVSETARTSLRITLYSNGLALINDQRRSEFTQGINSLAVSDISPQMIEDSARFTASKPFEIIEQAYLPRSLTHQNLLRAFVGKAVKVAVFNPDSGSDIIRDAVLITAEPAPVLRIGGRIETTVPGRIMFPEIPPGLRGEPVFRITGQAASAGPVGFDLTYLSSGFSWQASHTLTLDTSGKSARLETWANLSNSSGFSLKDSRIQVVAGTVQRRSPERRPQQAEMRLLKAGAMMADAPTQAPVRQSVGGFHLYTLPGTFDLPGRSRKQVALLRAVTLPVTRRLISEAHANPFAPLRTAAMPTYPGIRLILGNDKTAGPGQPIPGGIARLYGKDAEGRVQFLGEDRLKDLPVGASATISTGRAFDVTVTRQQTDYVREGLGRNTFEMAYRIRITNGSDAPQTVDLLEIMTGEWKILSESVPHTRDNNRARWRLSVPAKGNTEMTYRVRTRN